MGKEQFKFTSGNVSPSVSLAHNRSSPAYPSSLHYSDKSHNSQFTYIVAMIEYTAYPATRVVTYTWIN